MILASSQAVNLAANLVADLRERVASMSKACRKQVLDVSGHEETETLHMG